ncbi:MAG TPA: ABC transporter permease subunit [Dokdonella sp.]|uniref:PstA family ABC transporter permease n=1 Tax=Dokdonella sp. TaxID=2291710 RepID=UPI002C01049D|nr:ABC transporter permease subunit [Dokdonella sp.]HUD41579.1 ABC transporter permease subunit [Dokdonella sp.]
MMRGAALRRGRIVEHLAAGSSAAGLALCLLLAGGIVLLLVRAGLAPFWPQPVIEYTLRDGRSVLGELMLHRDGALIVRGDEQARPGDGYVRLREAEILAERQPPDAVARVHADGRRSYRLGEAGPDEPDLVGVDRRNALTFAGKLAFFGERLRAYAIGGDRSGDAGQGLLPALAGTLTLVLLMSLIVMPIGVAAAVHLHVYAGRGRIGALVRGAVGSLADVPSIVYGVLGLGLFVHGIGGGIDRWLHADRLPVPTFGTGGLLWAALTLAVLTLPVVVATVEQGLARIPDTQRLGSLALGATRGETLRRLLLPQARPAVLSAWILAVARAVGAVAPLMLVGVVKYAPASPIDAAFPYLHPSRQFTHLGFAVYDQALISPDALVGVPRAYSAALLLVALVLVLNAAAGLVGRRLRDRDRAFPL